jgi:general secretion pathway protein A
VFLSATHREALSSLMYGIRSRKGITALIGEAGTGKTTLVQALLARPMPHTRVAYISNPTLSREEFFALLASRFDLSAGAAAAKGRFLAELQDSALGRHQAGGTTAVIIDEAQALPLDLMEEVRLLTNLETTTDKLLSVVLSGQPELTARMNHPSMRQVKQRVAVRCELRPLDRGETHAYIAARVRTAGGGDNPLFTCDAIDLIHERSGGIPRTISVICDNALVNTFALRLPIVDAEAVLEVCRDFDLPHRQATPLEPRRTPIVLPQLSSVPS